MTGMTEEQILWELPLSRGLAYMHAALVMHGTEMVWGGEKQEDEIMQRAIALMKERKR